MINFSYSGGFDKTIKYMSRVKNTSSSKIFDLYGKMGVEALRSYTPKDSGITANAWRYTISKTETSTTINFINDHTAKGWFNIALYLQYGHGTRNGGWVYGRDYINPAIRPVFDKMVRELWRDVTKI